MTTTTSTTIREEDMSFEVQADEEVAGVPLLWPTDFKLRVPGHLTDQIKNPTWSPDFTQVACIAIDDLFGFNRIVIFDHVHGLLPFHRRRGDSDGDDDVYDDGRVTNSLSWIAHDGGYGTNLKYSPNGKFLVSASETGLVKLWEYGKDVNRDGYYYQQLQVWNVGSGHSFTINVDISPCSGFVAILYNRLILLKDVYNNGNTVESTILPKSEIGEEIIFSNGFSDGSHRSMFVRSRKKKNDNASIRVWNPYSAAAGDGNHVSNSLYTILQQPSSCGQHGFALSHDNSMIVMRGGTLDNCTTTLYSIVDTFDRKTGASAVTTSLIRTFPKSSWGSIHFLADDKSIVYNNGTLKSCWNIEEEESMPIILNQYMDLQICSFSRYSTDKNGQYMIIFDAEGRNRNGDYYISFYENNTSIEVDDASLEHKVRTELQHMTTQMNEAMQESGLTKTEALRLLTTAYRQASRGGGWDENEMLHELEEMGFKRSQA